MESNDLEFQYFTSELTPFRSLSGNFPSCCGLEWMRISPSLDFTSIASSTCGNQSMMGKFANLSMNDSFCRCKFDAYLQSGNQTCFNLTNSSLQSRPLTCAKGCPIGMRVYRTGFSFSCSSASVYNYDVFTQYETACERQSLPFFFSFSLLSSMTFKSFLFPIVRWFLIGRLLCKELHSMLLGACLVRQVCRWLRASPI